MKVEIAPSADEVFSQGPLIPVLVIDDEETALPIAGALLDAGIRVLEVTLRTPRALAVIEKISRHLPETMVGAGTVLNAEQVRAAVDAGARFLISPGLTPDLLKAARQQGATLIPGVATVSEVMAGLEQGYECFKFFPAEAAGGIAALKAFGGPLPGVKFCPTGGIDADNALSYLTLDNVACVGGSWLLDKEILRTGNWSEITRRAEKILRRLDELHGNFSDKSSS